MFQSLAHRTLVRVHLAIKSLLWVWVPVDTTRLYPVAGEGRMPRFSILPTEKVWIAWVRFYLSCAYGVRGSVPAIIFGWYRARPDDEWNIDWFLSKRLLSRFRTVSSRRQARAVAHWYDKQHKEAWLKDEVDHLFDLGNESWYDSQVDMIDTYDAW